MTPDGRWAVSGSGDNTLRVWDLESGQCLRTLEGHGGWVWFVRVTPDGRRAVSGGSRDKTLRMWDLESGRCLRTLEGHSGPVTSVSVTPDGWRVVSSCRRDKTVRVWDLESGLCLAVFPCDAWVQCVTLAQDGRTVVAGTRAGEVLFLEIHGL